MNPARRQNLERLLNPRHVALVGGEEAAVVAGECARIGFQGAIWPVNPHRKEIGGVPCFAGVGDLPAPPDAAFVAVPRAATVDIVAALAEMGAGGAVCYSAGFGETGDEGAELESALVEACGDLALIGPNCYGVINYLDRVALWPFAHGGGCPGYGAAIITQSGMLSSDLTMSQRSVPFAFMVAAGNQSVLTLEDFVDVLSARPDVRAIGLHIEGIRDIEHFAESVLRALDRNVPVVALKTGTSRIGARLTVSHTGSLSGTDDLYQALFERLGVIRVRTPAQLLETLKFLCVAGVPLGNRIAGLTCSGGAATMLADHAETLRLRFPEPTEETAETLRKHLPYTATLSNPLDYTTPIWGHPERTRPVFEAFFQDPCDAAVIVQDYPLPGLDESKSSYLADAEVFVEATRSAGVPAAVCSTLPENIDTATREMLVSRGVAPMQGIQETLDAIAGAVWHAERRDRVRGERFVPHAVPRRVSPGRFVDEWDGKCELRQAGLDVPRGVMTSAAGAAEAAAGLGFPVVVKMLSDCLHHKTEAGAVALGLGNVAEVDRAISRIRGAVGRFDAAALTDRFLVEEKIGSPVGELLVNVRADAQFGLAMTLASGGVFAELLSDAVTVLLPAGGQQLKEGVERLKVSRLLAGYRGADGVDLSPLVDTLSRLAEHVLHRAGDITEIEINPLFVLRGRVCAVDVLMQVAGSHCSPGRAKNGACI